LGGRKHNFLAFKDRTARRVTHHSPAIVGEASRSGVYHVESDPNKKEHGTSKHGCSLLHLSSLTNEEKIVVWSTKFRGAFPIPSTLKEA